MISLQWHEETNCLMKTKTEGQNCICVKPQIHKTYEDDVQQGSSEVETGKESCD